MLINRTHRNDPRIGIYLLAPFGYCYMRSVEFMHLALWLFVSNNSTLCRRFTFMNVKRLKSNRSQQSFFRLRHLHKRLVIVMYLCFIYCRVYCGNRMYYSYKLSRPRSKYTWYDSLLISRFSIWNMMRMFYLLDLLPITILWVVSRTTFGLCSQL